MSEVDNFYRQDGKKKRKKLYPQSETGGPASRHRAVSGSQRDTTGPTRT